MAADLSGLAAGIDCGSSFCKGVLVGNGAILAAISRPTGWNVEESGGLVLKDLLEKGSAADAFKTQGGRLAATGYGREKILGALRTLTEISAHARGADYLFPGIKTIIDVGGQDSKVISVADGRVLDFQMNDKCAAGSGRFLEMVLRRLDLDSLGMDAFLARGKEALLNSTCVVFAETEIIGLLSDGASREEIIGGAALSLAKRIVALAGRVGIVPPAALTGGLSESSGFRKILSKTLGIELQPLPLGAYSGAIGAAITALP
jgi:predicted CoA-substrate-specific enzyme activase